VVAVGNTVSYTASHDPQRRSRSPFWEQSSRSQNRKLWRRRGEGGREGGHGVRMDVENVSNSLRWRLEGFDVWRKKPKKGLK
jgi:hypothetical protein